jgi:hypothetical protein
MPEISTYRTPGNVHTDTSGFGGGAGSEGMDPFFLSLAQRQIAYQDEIRQQQRQDRKDRKNAEKNALRRERNPPRDPLKHLKTQAEAAQLQAVSRPAPTKTTYVGTSPGFQELDPLAMTAFQRQAFLPQNAGMERGGLTPDEELAPLREGAKIEEAARVAAAKRATEERSGQASDIERAQSRAYYGLY